ncbi:hypothetical protein Dsin_028145 [Dipteronia sinensis]|uniref:Calcium uniporter protein C-terminal domain-containing protein n=1 Tax=Dipteronia sinensis TaxID=43782 RepID=A0AAD9ZQ91_9ROSI|nr:hypothetical protein Dsin_028145 [Dipteronia sinensis]
MGRTVWSSGLLKHITVLVAVPAPSRWWRMRRTVCTYDDTNKNGDSRSTWLKYCCNIESWKMKLSMEGKEVVGYGQLLEACEKMGFARDKVFLHPYKVVDNIRRSIAEVPKMREELRILQEKKLQIDIQAHKQVRRIFWFGLSLASFKLGLFVWLTYWEFSWEVTSPIAYFYTVIGTVLGYSYFVITGRYPTSSDLLERLFLSAQRKLFRKHNFDVNRFQELQKQLKTPLDANAPIKNRLQVELDQLPSSMEIY